MPFPIDLNPCPGNQVRHNPFLSVIIPAYNEETRLSHTLELITRFLDIQPYSYELLVVENGSRDKTLEIAEGFALERENIRVLREAHPGKGRAVRRGMLNACGLYRFMCDADLSMPIESLNLFLPPALVACDLAIGSREAPGSIRYNEPFYRHLGGRLINLMIRLLALPGIQDTQCGFKVFHSRICDDLFRLQTLTGWAFDVELLYIARKRSYRLAEVPVPWYYRKDSKVRVMHDGLRIVLDMIRIRWNDMRGLYDPK